MSDIPVNPPAPTRDRIQVLVQSVRSTRPISLGPRRTASLHEFYRYPGRFSPEFARSAIDAFTEPGQLVLDPFVGGGTTAVEAALAGRRALVADINPLATFVTRVKTTPLTNEQKSLVRNWINDTVTDAKIYRAAAGFHQWRAAGYLRHIESRETWRITKLIRLALERLPTEDAHAEQFCRCVLLRTAQWAFDMGSRIPKVSEFREVLAVHGDGMLAVVTALSPSLASSIAHLDILDAALPDLSSHPRIQQVGSPELILTSPPYPGVHIAYHRWKLFSRKETPAPYWIADQEDRNGMAHYTMSARSGRDLKSYFAKLHAAYTDLAAIASDRTILVQIVGFSDARKHLPRFLKTMTCAGFTEFLLPQDLTDTQDGRLWRSIPGRRWWTQAHSRRGITAQTSREVVLFHRPSPTRAPR